MIYFKHHSNMRHDVKLKRVIAKYGLEGYGLYNLIVESITESLSVESPIPDLQETCEDIALFYNGNTAKINEMANFMINQGLFNLDELSGAIICKKVYKFLDTSQTRSEKLRHMIRAYKESQKKLLSETVSDGQCNTMTKMKEEEKNKKRKELEKEEDPPLLRIDQLITHAIETWNLLPLPRCRYTVFNLPKIAEVKEKFGVFSIDEIDKAISNLAKHYEEEESKYRPSSFENFMTRSIDRWTDEAKPWERYKKNEILTDIEEVEF